MIKLCKYYKIVFEQIKPSLAKGCLAGQEGFSDDFGYLLMEGVLSARIQSENTELWCLGRAVGTTSVQHIRFQETGVEQGPSVLVQPEIPAFDG